MPEPGPDSDEHSQPTAAATPAERRSPISGYGVAAAVLAVLAVAAAALLAVLWAGHRSEQADRDYQGRALAAAADWTTILINMNGGNVEESMARLRDGTIGELNTGFDKSIAPYRDVVKKLQSSTTGQVESVSIEVMHNALTSQPGQRSPAPPALPDELSARTQTVLVVATSVSENTAGKSGVPDPGAPGGPTSAPGAPGGPTSAPGAPGGPTSAPGAPGGPTSAPGAPGGPTTVRWNLRLGVSDVDGVPKISRLESLR
jgi:hypothetical protein